MDGESHPEADGWIVAVHATNEDFEPIGSGVLLDDTRILTCAHVVHEKDEIWVAFPKTDEDTARRRVKAVIPPAAGTPVRDLVILVLAEPAPSSVTPAPLRCPRPGDLVGKRWWAFGFPGGDPVGSAADGQVGSALAYGWVRLDTTSRYPVQKGFSGGGLWSPDYQAVVGVVSHTNPKQGDGRAITFHQADQCFPDQKLRTLAERYKASDAGDVALTQWGWSLADDPEAQRHWRPRARGVSIDSERGYRFRGRTEALTEITAWLASDHPERRVLLVTGDPGAGKSAVLGRIVTTADPEAARQLPASDTAVRAEPGSVACAVHAKSRTALEIAKEIAKAASAPLPEHIEDFPPSLRDSLSERQAPRFNVIIDALDESAEPRTVIAKVILPIAETCADTGARLVVGTRRHDTDGDLLAAFGPAARIVDLNAPAYFTPADLAAYTLATLQLSGDDRANNPYTNPKISIPLSERIAALSSANFLVAGLVARTHGLYDESPADLSELSFTPSVEAAMREYLTRIPDVNGIPAERLLTALAYAESPDFPISLWRVAVQALGAGDLSETALKKFTRSKAASFIIESTGEDATSAYRLFHQALNDALRNHANPRDDEQSLTRAFMKAGQQSGWDRAPSYLLRSLPSHAARAEMVDALLADDDYLLHADLLQVRAVAHQTTSTEGRKRARLLRLCPPEAIMADAPARAAMFSVTEVLEEAGDSFRRKTTPKIPYSAAWAAAQRSQEHLILHGHDSGVNAACAFISADGTPRIATTSTDKTIRIWNPDTGTEIHTLTGHNNGVWSVCAYTSTDGTPRIATASLDQTVRIWNPSTRTEIHTLTGHDGPILSVCAYTTTDGTPRIATTSADETVRIWNPDTGTQLRALTGHNNWAKSVCAYTSADGTPRIATTSDDKTIRIWNPDTGTEIHTLTGHNDGVWSVCAYTTADGTPRIATTSDDKTIRIWDPDTGTEIHTLTDHTDSVNAVCAYTSADGTPRIATTSDDKTIRIWDPDTGTETRAIHSHGDGVNAVCPYTAVDRTPRIATFSTDRAIRIWDPDTGTEIHSLTGHDGPILSVCAYTTTDGTPRLATASLDQTIRTWDPHTGTRLRTLVGSDRVRSVCAYTTTDGTPRLATTTATDGTIRIWNPDTATEIHTLTGHTDWIRSVCSYIAADGTPRLATASIDGTIRIWNPDTATEIHTLTGHNNWSQSACAYTTTDGTPRLATTTDGTIRIWNPDTATEIHTLTGHNDEANAMCAYIAADGAPRLATATGRTVRVWDPELETSLMAIPVRDEAMSVAYIGGLLFAGTATGLLAIQLHLGH